VAFLQNVGSLSYGKRGHIGSARRLDARGRGDSVDSSERGRNSPGVGAITCLS